MGIPRRAIHASCESPWHSLAKHCILDTCFLLTAPFRACCSHPKVARELSPNGSSDTCIADGVFHIPMPCFHGAIPVYPRVINTFLHNASRRTRRAMHASRDAPCHSSAQPPLLGGLPPPHGAFQEHAAHLVEWSTTLNSKGSAGTCIPEGVATFFHAAFTAHSGSDAGADAGSRQLQALVRQACVGILRLGLPHGVFRLYR